MGTLGEAGGIGAPAARPPGSLWRLLSTAQPPAPCDHPHAMPARHGRGGDRHRVVSMELGTTAKERLCPGHGALPLVSTGGAADHRGHHARRGDPENPPASEARGGPAPDCTGVCPPRSLRLVLRLTAQQPSSGPGSVILPLPAGGEGWPSGVLLPGAYFLHSVPCLSLRPWSSWSTVCPLPLEASYGPSLAAAASHPASRGPWWSAARHQEALLSGRPWPPGGLPAAARAGQRRASRAGAAGDSRWRGG